MGGLPGNRERDQSLPGIGGAYNSVNLSVYSYAGQSPLVHVDPDGEKLVRVLLDTSEAQKYVQINNNGRGIVVDEKWAPAVRNFINAMIEKKTYVSINSSFRTTKEQKKLAGTNPLATKGTSAHEAGLALDISVRKDPKGKWLNPADATGVKSAAKEEGMRWGPDFKDPPHVDAAYGGVFGYPSREAAAKENQADWEKNGTSLPSTPLSGGAPAGNPQGPAGGSPALTDYCGSYGCGA